MTLIVGKEEHLDVCRSGPEDEYVRDPIIAQ